MVFNLTADFVDIDYNDDVFGVFYTLDEDEAFEKLGEELFKAEMLDYSDESGNDPDEVETWFFENSEVAEWNATAEKIYNPTISRNDIRVKCHETRVAIVNGVMFSVSVTASKCEMYKNKEAQKLV